MRKFIIVFMLTFSFAAYNVGQTISITDQSLEREVCAGAHYEVGDTMSLLDLNGAENGGDEDDRKSMMRTRSLKYLLEMK